MKLANFKISLNEKDKKEDKNVLVVYADKNRLRKLKVPSRLYKKEDFEKNNPIIVAPYKGYKKLIIIPFDRRKINPFLLSKMAFKVEENATIDLRALKDYQELMIEFVLSKATSLKNIRVIIKIKKLELTL